MTTSESAPGFDLAAGRTWMRWALQEARAGIAEGGEPVGAAVVSASGELLGSGRNQFVQRGDVTAHAEVEAVRAMSPRSDYRDLTLLTTADPCWYCCGLVRHLEIGRVVVGATAGWGGASWLRSNGHEVWYVADDEAMTYLKQLPVWAPPGHDPNPMS